MDLGGVSFFFSFCPKWFGIGFNFNSSCVIFRVGDGDASLAAYITSIF